MTKNGEGQAVGGEPSTSPNRTTYLAAVAGLIVLIGLVGFALLHRRDQGAPSQSSPEAPAGAEMSVTGKVVSATPPISVSPETSIIAERYRCMCSVCDHPLTVCNCSREARRDEMMAYLQSLVDAGKSGSEIDQAMVEKYGRKVLLSEPLGDPEDASSGDKPAR